MTKIKARSGQTLLSTTIPTELIDLLKEKVAAIRECGITHVTISSLAASFLASQIEHIDDIEPDEIAAGLAGKLDWHPPAAALHHLSMSVDCEVSDLLREKIKAIKRAGCTGVSLSSLTSSFLMSQFDEISSLDAHELAADMVGAGAEPCAPGGDDEAEDTDDDDEGGATGDSEGGGSPAGEEAEGEDADEDSAGEDQGSDDDGDEEVPEEKEG